MPQADSPQNWRHLLPFGYAPGNYMNRCFRCGAVHTDLDKRAMSCRPCAEQAFNQSKATQ